VCYDRQNLLWAATGCQWYSWRCDAHYAAYPVQAAKALEVENEKLQEKQDELTADVYLLSQENAKLKLQVDDLSKVRLVYACLSRSSSFIKEHLSLRLEWICTLCVQLVQSAICFLCFTIFKFPFCA
jgi:hypothetical protein